MAFPNLPSSLLQLGGSLHHCSAVSERCNLQKPLSRLDSIIYEEATFDPRYEAAHIANHITHNAEQKSRGGRYINPASHYSNCITAAAAAETKEVSALR